MCHVLWVSDLPAASYHVMAHFFARRFPRADCSFVRFPLLVRHQCFERTSHSCVDMCACLRGADHSAGYGKLELGDGSSSVAGLERQSGVPLMTYQELAHHLLGQAGGQVSPFDVCVRASRHLSAHVSIVCVSGCVCTACMIECMRACVRVHACMYVYACMYMCLCTCTCICVCVMCSLSLSLCVCARARMYMYTRTSIHAYTYIHSMIRTCTCNKSMCYR